MADYDLVINMAGFRLPGPAPKELIEWQVHDPYGSPMEVYRAVRSDLEQRVMRLIAATRAGSPAAVRGRRSSSAAARNRQGPDPRPMSPDRWRKRAAAGAGEWSPPRR